MDLDILHVAVPGKPRADLAGAASKIFGCLGVADFEERESSNYPTGAYLAGAKDSAKFEVSLEDDQAFGDYDFWLTVKLPGGFPTPLAEFVARTVERLLGCGFQVSRQEIDDPEGTSTRIVRTVFSLAETPSGARLQRRRELITID
jgi:hypothetical protein